MLHIFNHYSIGRANHDGDSSVYVSLDLLKLFSDSKLKIDQFAKYF